MLIARRQLSKIRAIPKGDLNNLTPPSNRNGADNSFSSKIFSSQNDDNSNFSVENVIIRRSNSPISNASHQQDISDQQAEESDAPNSSSDWTADEFSSKENREVEEINESTDSKASEEENENIQDMNRLHEWAIKNKIRQNHLDELLAICRRHWLPDLPKSSKTFLGTSRASYNIPPMESACGKKGEFVYFGVGKGIEACIELIVYSERTIHLKFSVDGLPISKSDNTQLCPILCQVDHNQIYYEPFVVAMFCGMSKPVRNLVYFEQFCEDVNQLLANGLEIEGHEYNIKIN